MAHAKILQPDRTYTFSRFFEMTVDPEELLAEFGYGLSKDLNLFRVPEDLGTLLKVLWEF